MIYKPKYLEKAKWGEGKLEVNFYEEALNEARAQEARQKRAKHMVKAEEMPWDYSSEGKLKHMVNDKMNVAIKSLDVFRVIQEIIDNEITGSVPVIDLFG